MGKGGVIRLKLMSCDTDFGSPLQMGSNEVHRDLAVPQEHGLFSIHAPAREATDDRGGLLVLTTKMFVSLASEACESGQLSNDAGLVYAPSEQHQADAEMPGSFLDRAAPIASTIGPLCAVRAVHLLTNLLLTPPRNPTFYSRRARGLGRVDAQAECEKSHVRENWRTGPADALD
jgi:hypothetical protein